MYPQIYCIYPNFPLFVQGDTSGCHPILCHQPLFLSFLHNRQPFHCFFAFILENFTCSTIFTRGFIYPQPPHCYVNLFSLCYLVPVDNSWSLLFSQDVTVSSLTILSAIRLTIQNTYPFICLQYYTQKHASTSSAFQFPSLQVVLSSALLLPKNVFFIL